MAETLQATPKVTRKGAGAAGVLIWLIAFTFTLGMFVQLYTLITGISGLSALLGQPGAPALLENLPHLNSIHLKQGATVSLGDVYLGLRLLGAVPGVVMATTLLIAALLTTQILASIRRGESFAAPVVARWGRLAATLLVGSLLYTAADVIYYFRFNEYLSSGPAWDGLYSSMSVAGLDIPWLLLLLGLLAGVLGMAFRQGAKLQEEVEGVV